MKYLFKNVGIISTFPSLSRTENACLVVSEDIIEFIGSQDDVTVRNIAQQENVQVVDLGGRFILPSFIDAHMHLLLFAASLTKVALEDCSNLEEIRAAITAYAKQHPDKKRIFCKGWRQPTTDGNALASMIDDLDPRPIIIDAEDLHSTWCNTAALQEMGVQDMPDPVGGHIFRDERGNSSGLLSETAALTIAWPHFARTSTLEEKKECIRAAIRVYNAAGYTGVVEMAMDEDVWDVLKVLRDQEGLNLRIAAHWLINPSATDAENLAQVDKAIAEHDQHNLSNSPDFRIAGIKLVCDGVIDACTAFVSKPYTNGELPDPLWQPAALQKVVTKADAAGLQCALHAIGDAAVRMAVDTLSALTTTGRRHRIEHLEFTSPEDARRLGAAGITASIQPVHCDPKILGAWPSLIGADRCARAFAYREFKDHGAHIAIGTDSPTAPHLPFPNLYHATTRKSMRAAGEKGPPPLNPQFALELGDALAATSWGGAYSCFAERFTGSLEVGKKADFVVVEMGGEWEWEVDLEGLLRARVVETWFEGRRVFAIGDS